MQLASSRIVYASSPEHAIALVKQGHGQPVTLGDRRQAMRSFAALSSGVIPGISPASSIGQLALMMAALGIAGGLSTMLLAKLFGAAHATAWGVGGGVASMVLGYPGLAGAAQAPTTCPDGTPIPAGGIGQCGALGSGLGPSNQSNQTYNYTGQPTSNVQTAASALAAVDPCQCSSVPLVRAFQCAAGLTVSGQTDGRYGSNTQTVLGRYVSNPPAPCATQSWEGPEGTYTNPGCPGDTSPTC